MNNELRNKRVRALVKTLNRDRKKQGKQIDILCHDLIDAQRQFIRRLGHISFTSTLYKSLLGISDVRRVFEIVSDQIAGLIPGVETTFYIRQAGGAREFACLSKAVAQADRLESLFTDELVEAVCRANKVCDLNELLGMGLQVPPVLAKRVWAATIPLLHGYRAMGFILLTTWDDTGLALGPEYTTQIANIGSGLGQAIVAGEKVSRTG